VHMSPRATGRVEQARRSDDVSTAGREFSTK
jgi:hypothetical protein